MMSETGSRERLLEAAWDLASKAFDQGDATRTTPRVFDQLTAARVSRHAGLTTGAFYNRWLDRDAFMVDFLEYVLSVSRSQAVEEVMQLVQDLQNATPEELAVESVKRTVDATIDDPAFAMHLYLWALTRSREVVVDHLRQGYEKTRLEVNSLIQVYLTMSGRELRPPFTESMATTMMIALVEGIALQRGVDPESVGLESVAQAVMTLWTALSRRPGDERTGVEIFKNGI
jgi:AcrR family transcriptional regulator